MKVAGDILAAGLLNSHAACCVTTYAGRAGGPARRQQPSPAPRRGSTTAAEDMPALARAPRRQLMHGNTERMAERYAAYCELRDQGTGPWDAARRAGLSAATQERYERSHTERSRVRPPTPPSLTAASIGRCSWSLSHHLLFIWFSISGDLASLTVWAREPTHSAGSAPLCRQRKVPDKGLRRRRRPGPPRRRPQDPGRALAVITE
jgi:hypothetical protein